MDPRMQAREWFLDKPGTNKYDVEVHVQRSFWHNGFGEALFRCTKAEPPYRCKGFWRSQELEFEWVPRQWLTLYMQEYDENIVEGFSRVMRLEPSLRYTMTVSQDGHTQAAEAADDGEEAETAETGDQAGDAGEAPGTEAAEADTGSQERFVVEWRARNVEQRLRDLAEQAGVRDVRQMA